MRAMLPSIVLIVMLATISCSVQVPNVSNAGGEDSSTRGVASRKPPIPRPDSPAPQYVSPARAVSSGALGHRRQYNGN